VKLEEKVGVCDIATFVQGLHAPYVTIERISHLGKARSQLPNLAARITCVRTRDIAEEEQARALQLRDGGQETPRCGELIISHFEIWTRGCKQRRSGRPR
jgi:hypothetical protein